MLLDSTLPRSQYDYALPQVSFTAVGYHKHITLVFNPTVRGRGRSVKPVGLAGEGKFTHPAPQVLGGGRNAV